jgi:tryptophan 2,3-dioxygenase
LTEAERQQRAARTEGQPARDWSGDSTPYIDYQRIDVLLSLQHPRSEEPAEMTFYVMGQVKELLFKLLYVEICRVRDDLLNDRLASALWTLRRVDETQRVLEECWNVLASLSPSEFATFRDELGAASGLGSYMYRQLEFVIGNKSSTLAELHANVPRISEEVEAALRAPSVWDAAMVWLAAHGHAIDQECLQRDWSEVPSVAQSVTAAWTAIYRDPSYSPDAHRLGEALSSLAFRVHRWRNIHLLVVERLLGHRVGTGGTEGLEWLRRSAEHRVFPELWLARTGL